MKIKFLLILILTLFSLNVFALTDEEKARKIFVETNLELETNCKNNFSIFETLIDLSLGSYLSKFRGAIDLDNLESISDYQIKVDDSIDCFNFIKDNYLQAINTIQRKYPTTQVAYDLSIDANIVMLKQSTNQILESLLQEKKDLDFYIVMKKEEIEEENKRLQAKIEKENNRIINCFTSEGLKYEKKNIEGCNEGDFDYNPVGLTNEEMYVLIDQLRGCFNLRAGIQMSGDELVTISAKVADNGRVINPTVRLLSTNISKKNQYYEAIIESALSTLHHPSCSLLKVPLDKYDSWKKLKITIDYSWMK